ncbi:MAG: penicillin-binding protein [Anaerolineaceae bacterium]|nr:penicillin-binding protein [Anaerolineaceae bacterium]
MKSRLQTLLIVKDRIRRRSQRSVDTRHSLRQISLVFLIVLLILLASIPVIGGYFYTQLTNDLPSVEWIPALLDPDNGVLLAPTVLLDQRGEKEIFWLEELGANRRFLSLDPNQTEFISPYVVQLTVAVYQPDFWTSPGYNRNLLSTGTERTIAERLVEKLLLWDEPDNLSKILQMRLLASQITKRYGRAQVLEWFLNSSGYGHNTIGIDSAARLYLNKKASELNLAEAALLVAVSQTPALNPLDAPQAAEENQSNLLNQLHEDGFIADEDYQYSTSTELELVSEIQEKNEIASAFASLVMQELFEIYGRERVELGGLRVITSLDFEIQTALQCTLEAQLDRLNGTANNQSSCSPERFLPSLFDETLEDIGLEGSGIILEPRTGEIIAMVGNLDGQQESSFITVHQAGSILSPLVAVNAFARGFSPATQVWDIPANLPDDLSTFHLPVDEYKGPMRLRTALANDYLTGVNKLLQQLGTDVVSRSSQSFGLITISTMENVQDFLYAGENATIVEVADFYRIFATQGIRNGKKNPANGLIEPIIIRQVELADGLPMDTFLIESQVILSPQLAYLVHDILRDDFERRETLGYPNLLEIGRPSGAKFGTTFEKDEIWTAGYTPQYVSVIWFGQSDDHSEILNPKIAGGVWYAMMQWLHQNLPVENWQEPTGITEVVVCNLSGLLPTRECPSTITERFIDGTQPVGYDTLFKSYDINRETGLLATVFTPPETIETRTFMMIPEDAIDWAVENGISIPPKNYDLIQAPNPSLDVVITTPANYSFVNGVVEILGTVLTDDMTSFRIQVGQGLNPESWLQIGEDNTRKISNRKIVDWDTTNIEDGLYALRLLVIRENFQVDTHTLQVSVDNTIPIGKIIYPLADQTIPRSSQGTITLQAEVFDQAGIDRVEWWLDGKKVVSINQIPYSYPISINAGKHSVFMKIYDLAGNETISSEFEFVVE